MEYNSKCLLVEIKRTKPIIAGKDITLIRPEAIVRTYDVPFEIAQKVTIEYNLECMQHEIEAQIKTSWLKPETLVTTHGYSIEEANKIAMEYNVQNLLAEIKRAMPIIEEEEITWANPKVIAESYSVPLDIAHKAATEYNVECVLNAVKRAHPINHEEEIISPLQPLPTTPEHPLSIARTYHIPLDIAQKVAMEYNAECLLYVVKSIYPIKNNTWLKPEVVAATFNMSIEMAQKVAMKYNLESLLNRIKESHPIYEGVITSPLQPLPTTPENPFSIAKTYNVPIEIAIRAAIAYNNEIISKTKAAVR